MNIMGNKKAPKFSELLFFKRRKLFNDNSHVPYFIDGETSASRRYKVLVVDGKKKRRRNLDNYRKRTKNELIEERYYDEL